MLDPESSLQDSKYIKQEKIQLHFWPSGKYSVMTHYIHVRVWFNFTGLLQRPNIIFQTYKKYTRIWPQPIKTQVKQINNVSCYCLADKFDYLMDFLDMLPRHTTVRRTKGQFGLVKFGISTAGLTLATYYTIQFSRLENRISANEKKVITSSTLQIYINSILRLSIKKGMTSETGCKPCNK